MGLCDKFNPVDRLRVRTVAQSTPRQVRGALEMKDTPRTAASKLTKAQAKALFDLNVNGPDAWARNFGRAGGTMIRLFGRMKEAGFVEGPPYKVTEYGELVLDELRARSASKSLGEN